MCHSSVTEDDALNVRSMTDELSKRNCAIHDDDDDVVICDAIWMAHRSRNTFENEVENDISISSFHHHCCVVTIGAPIMDGRSLSDCLRLPLRK